MKKTLYITGTLFFVTLVLGLSYYYYVWNDHGKEQQESIAEAKEKYGISDVQNIEHYYGSHGAFDVIKSKVDQEESYIFIPLNDKAEPKIINSKDGWDVEKVKQYVQQELDPDDLISIRLGMEKFRNSSPFTPVWEIVYKNGKSRYTFHYIRYEDGTFFKKYTMNQQL